MGRWCLVSERDLENRLGDERDERGSALSRRGFGRFQRNEIVWHVGVVLVQFALDAGAVFVAVVEFSLVACFFTLFFLPLSFCYRISAVPPPL